MKTYHNEADTSGITKIALKIFLDFFGQIRNKTWIFPGPMSQSSLHKGFYVYPCGSRTLKRLQNQAQVQFNSVSVIPDRLTKFDQIYRTIIMP